MAYFQKIKGGASFLYNDDDMVNTFDNMLTWSQKRSIFISALKKSLKPMLSDAKSTSRKVSKKSSKSLGIIPRKKEFTVKIGYRRGDKFGNLSHIFERGTENRGFKIDFFGEYQNTGRIKGGYYLKNAYDNKLPDFKRNIEEELKNSFENFLERRKERGKK